MRVVGIQVANRERGEQVVEALEAAAVDKRISLEDVALVMKGEDDKVQIMQTRDATPAKGAVKGSLVGAVIGLAAPPLLGMAALGAGAGALWGRLRDRGIDDQLMKYLVEPIQAGHGVVFALGDDASIDAIEARVKELGTDELLEVTLDQHDESALREFADEILLPQNVLVNMPIH